MDKGRIFERVLALVAVATLIVGVVVLNEQGTQYQTMGLSGPGVSDMDSLTLSNDLIVGDDATVTDDLGVTGDATVGGTLGLTGAGTFAGIVNNGSLDQNDNIDQDGASDEVQLAVTGYTTQTSDLVNFDGGLTDIGGGSCSVAQGDNDLCVAGDVEVDGELELDGALDADSTANIAGATIFGLTIDVASTVNFGTDDLYPVGYASADQQMECGVTATFTDTVAVTASALTTATYVVATQITDPAATAVFLTVDAPAANVFNIDSWESDYTVGTTGITAYWCAVGNQ